MSAEFEISCGRQVRSLHSKGHFRRLNGLNSFLLCFCLPGVLYINIKKDSDWLSDCDVTLIKSWGEPQLCHKCESKRPAQMLGECWVVGYDSGAGERFER